MNKKGLIFILVVVAVAVTALSLHTGESKTKPYYSGDAIYYNGQTLVASANSGSLEIFKLNSRALERIVKFRPARADQYTTDSFNTVLFNEEDGRLYVYAASASTLFKYDFSDTATLNLVQTAKDTTWDWLGQLSRVGGRLATAGSKMVKLWNTDLQVVDSFRVVNQTNPYNVRLDDAERFVFDISGKELTIFDRATRSIVRHLDLAANNLNGNRRLSYDTTSNLIYVIDDQAVKQFSFAGDLFKTLRHDSRFGYDAVLSADNRYLYVSNGTSVAKLDKYNFKFAAAFENRDLRLADSWAMGLATLASPQGEMVAVFNNSNIVLLDKNLRVIATVSGTEEEGGAVESMYLKVNQSSAAPFAPIVLSGGGFGLNEKLTIYFADRLYEAQADTKGRFSATLYVPLASADRVDIKVVGQTSGQHYNLAFTILKPSN